MTTLKQARENGNFEQFIKERECIEVDETAFNDLLRRVERDEKPAKLL